MLQKPQVTSHQQKHKTFLAQRNKTRAHQGHHPYAHAATANMQSKTLNPHIHHQFTTTFGTSTSTTILPLLVLKSFFFAPSLVGANIHNLLPCGETSSTVTVGVGVLVAPPAGAGIGLAGLPWLTTLGPVPCSTSCGRFAGPTYVGGCP